MNDCEYLQTISRRVYKKTIQKQLNQTTQSLKKLKQNIKIKKRSTLNFTFVSSASMAEQVLLLYVLARTTLVCQPGVKYIKSIEAVVYFILLFKFCYLRDSM